MVRISACRSSVSSSSASSDTTQVPAHLSIAEFFCSANPFQSSEKTFAPNDLAISTVRSVEPESTTTISSATRTLASVRARLSASLRVMIATESVDRAMPCLFYLPHDLDKLQKSARSQPESASYCRVWYHIGGIGPHFRQLYSYLWRG